jgi:hypothetical protein
MITNLERKLLTAIRDSDFNYGCNPVDNPVWVDCIMCDAGMSNKTGSGVMSSLVKKGLVKTNGECCTILKAGMGELNSAQS